LLLAFNKPWGVLCQFTQGQGRTGECPTLADYINVPAVYSAGRLDLDSEGLLLLTDDGRLQHRIADPEKGLHKCYLVQVEGVPTASQLQRLRSGIRLKDGPAHAVQAELLSRKPGWLWPRKPPVRQRKNIAVSWLEVTLAEGRNRQVRRMTAAVGLPTLRLVRLSIGEWKLAGLQPGEWRMAASYISRNTP